MKTLLLTLVAVVASAQTLNPLRGWWHSQARLRAALCLLLLGPSSTQAQCDWSKKIESAIERRYKTNRRCLQGAAGIAR
jgi:hypothetical protein